MSKTKEVYVNTLIVDGKILHVWTGKRITKRYKELAALKGIEVKQEHSRVEA